jgi:hypothetical protein
MKRLVFALLMVVLLLGTIACGSSDKATTYPTTTVKGAPQQEAIQHQYGLDSSSGSGVRTPTPIPTPTIMVGQPPPLTLAVPPSPGSVYYGEVSVPSDRMVINSAYLALVVDDVSASLAQITNLTAAFGGYVVNSNVYEEQNRLIGNISFRVDSARFNEALQALRDLAVDVRSEQTSGEDVTEEYVDLDARHRNLEASEAQLLELMKQAGTVEEILKVQQELVATREQIEQTKGRLQYLEQSSSLAYINASLEQSKLSVEFVAYARTVKEGQDIQFESTVSGGFSPYTFEWDFGDGETSTEANPVHAYRSDGLYTVTLKIKDDKEHTADFVRKDYISVSAGWQAGNTANTAWKGLVAFGHFLANLFIWLGYFSPLWIAVLLILYFTWWRKRKKKTQ